jgi:hypothetical protein
MARAGRIMVERRPNSETVAWSNDLRQRSALDLDPPYPRRRAWHQTFKNYFIESRPRRVTLGPWRVRGWDGGTLLALILLGLLVAGCGAVDGSGSAGAAHQLVGFSKAQHPGDVRLFGLTRACQAEFPGSRLCSSVEVMETTAIPDGLEGNAWVRPSFVSAIDRSVLDASGLVLLGGPPSNCDQWKGTVSTGIIVDSDGNFSSGRVARCSESRSVACCAPTP